MAGAGVCRLVVQCVTSRCVRGLELVSVSVVIFSIAPLFKGVYENVCAKAKVYIETARPLYCDLPSLIKSNVEKDTVAMQPFLPTIKHTPAYVRR